MSRVKFKHMIILNPKESHDFTIKKKSFDSEITCYEGLENFTVSLERLGMKKQYNTIISLRK